MNDKIYPAKLLLLGEYTVLCGSKSLAIPFPHFSLCFSRNGQNNHQGILLDYGKYLANRDFLKFGVSFDHKAYVDFLESGGFFETDIPIGYGVGSSGALTVAVYDLFFKLSEGSILSDNSILKALFAEMEGFFHGKSSGIDPLIIHLNRPVLSTASGEIKLVEIDSSSFGAFQLLLIDSGISRSTGDFVRIFNKKMEDKRYRKALIDPLSVLNTALIDRLIFKGGSSYQVDLFSDFTEISRLQFQAFQEMIPEHIYKVWESVLKGDQHSLKLCGAGGGGYFYLLSKDLNAFKKAHPVFKLINIPL